MIPWLINSMLCRLFFNTDLLHAFRRVYSTVTNLKITFSSVFNFHKVGYILKPPCFCASLAIFLLRMVTPAQINYRANQKPRNTCLLSLSNHTYLLISSFFLSPSFHFLQHLPFTWYL